MVSLQECYWFDQDILFAYKYAHYHHLVVSFSVGSVKGNEDTHIFSSNRVEILNVEENFAS